MIKKLLTLAIFFHLCFLANAQFKKGDFLLGGSLGFGDYNDAPAEQRYANISISMGKAINETTVVGIQLGYLPYWANSYSNYNLGPMEYRRDQFVGGMFYRKYKSLGKDFFLFGEAGAVYGWYSESGKDTSGTKLLTGSGINTALYLMPGFAYRVSNKFFLEITIPNLFIAQYNSQDVQAGSVKYKEVNNFTVSTSLSSNPLGNIGVGFRLVL